MFSLQREGMHGMITLISAAVPHRTRKSLWAHLTRVLHSGNYKVRGYCRTRVCGRQHVLADTSIWDKLSRSGFLIRAGVPDALWLVSSAFFIQACSGLSCPTANAARTDLLTPSCS